MIVKLNIILQFYNTLHSLKDPLNVVYKKKEEICHLGQSKFN